MRAAVVSASLALTSLVSVPPAFGSPFGVNDVAPSVETPIDPPSDVTAVSFETLRDPIPATCAQAFLQDSPTSSMPRPSQVPSPVLDISGTSDAAGNSNTLDALAEPASMTVDDGAYLVSGLLGCDGATMSAEASFANGTVLADPYPRLRAVTQTAAIIAAFLLITWLAYLVAAMTRSSRHHRAHRRRY